MADSAAPEKPDKVPESPTTARPLDFDDEQQEVGVTPLDAPSGLASAAAAAGTTTTSSTTPAATNTTTAATATTAPAATPAADAGATARSGSRVRFAKQEGAGGGDGGDDDDAPPPPKPARSPAARQAEAEGTLLEAFPSIDPKVVRAVLVASGGQVEPAFNALLGMSDPSFSAAEEAPPRQPPRPTTTGAQRQLEQDEMYARQLAEHYNSSDAGYGGGGGGGVGSGYGQAPPPRQDSRGYQTRPGPNYQGGGGGGRRRGDGRQGPVDPDDDKDYSFFDDELPQIRENLKKGFFQTQTKVNKWISDFQKRMDGDDSDGEGGTRPSGADRRQNYGPSRADQLHGIQKNAEASRARRSTDYDRYDADPQLLNDNFETLEMHDEEADVPPPKPARPTANPNLFKPTPPTPPQAGPVDEVDALYARPPVGPGTPSAAQRQPSPSSAKSKKWQPLTSVAPAPDAEDNDPFALGDSDDEGDGAGKRVDVRAADTERLKAKAAESREAAPGKTLEAAESDASGTRNKEAADLLGKET